jgi:hypothetical protein
MTGTFFEQEEDDDDEYQPGENEDEEEASGSDMETSTVDLATFEKEMNEKWIRVRLMPLSFVFQSAFD